MGYQALLFCPDEKTARTVTQVLSELDFSVVPCSEPFAAVKKLMAEHFDAVVVDCDNEQNATLLFKSAHNSASNQSSLAVAVVEGQAGVAKAFRIGANLVLTKPINVEQAKGTLRVARGLLRKGEPGKPAVAPSQPSASAAAVAAPPKAAAPRPAVPPTATPASLPPRPQRAVPAPVAKSSIPATKLTTKSVPESAEPEAEDAILSADLVVEAPAAKTTPAASFAQSEVKATTPGPKKPAARTSSSGIAGGIGGAASAPAPARETQSTIPAEVAPAKQPEPAVAAEPISTRLEAAIPAPSFTFGGAMADGSPSAEGGNKKIILGVAAGIVVVVGGYLGLSQFHGKQRAPVHVAQPAASAPAPPPAASTSAAATQASAPASVANTMPAVQPEASPAETQPEAIAESEKPAAKPAKSGSKPASGPSATKPPARAEEPSAPPAKAAAASKPEAQPIVVKNESSKAPVVKPAPPTDAPAPSVMGIAPASNSALPNLATTAPSFRPTLQTVNVSQGVSQGLLYKRVQPVYPSGALRMHLEGSVQLMATISKNGDITAVKTMSGDSQLAKAAADAVKQWKYKPYLLNGEPVEIQTQITVNFKLPH